MRGATPELAAVVTVTATFDADVPLSVIEVGDTEQVDRLGAPVQMNVTFWLNPPAEATVKPKLAVWPGETVAVNESPDIEKSSPAPISATV